MEGKNKIRFEIKKQIKNQGTIDKKIIENKMSIESKKQIKNERRIENKKKLTLK